jgi:hypothetical protein
MLLLNIKSRPLRKRAQERELLTACLLGGGWEMNYKLLEKIVRRRVRRSVVIGLDPTVIRII